MYKVLKCKLLRTFNNQQTDLMARGSRKSVFCLLSMKVLNGQRWLHVMIESSALNCLEFLIYVDGKQSVPACFDIICFLQGETAS